MNPMLESPLWSAHILTLFPDMFPGPLGHSLAGRALDKNIWSLKTHNLRDFATDKHANVDAPPFGGGHGMVMRADVVGRAIDHLSQPNSDGANLLRIYPSPRGQLLDQAFVRDISQSKGVMIICGRYEGLDQRVIDHYQLREVSIGDYILSGGEQAAMVLLDSVIRLLPGVLGKAASHENESFETDLLEYDHYTQPRRWRALEPPAILLSGHHQNIAKWRQKNAKLITKKRRLDLWQRYLAKNKENMDDID